MKITWLVLVLAIAAGYYLGGYRRHASTTSSVKPEIYSEPQVKMPPPIVSPTARLSKPNVPIKTKEDVKSQELIALEKKRAAEEADIIELRNAAGEIFRKQGLIE